MRAHVRFFIRCGLAAGMLFLVGGQSGPCGGGTFHASGHECPVGWHWYAGYWRCLGLGTTSTRTFNEARSYCLPYHVVLPGSDEENNALQRYRVSQGLNVNMWGGSSRTTEDRRIWSPALMYINQGQSPWDQGQPSTPNGGDNCLQIRASGKWNDEKCGERTLTQNFNLQAVLCERPRQCQDCSTAACGNGNYRHGCTSSTDSSCAACAAHTYGGRWRSSTCTDVCPAGQRVNDARSGCVNCPAGTFSGGSVAACTTCRANSWSGEGWGHCDCNAGFQDVSGTCTQCVVGQSSVSGGACTECGPGRTDASVFTTCKFCEIGFTSAAVGGCYPCPLGKSSSLPFTDCEWCGDLLTSTGEGGPCFNRRCLAGNFAPIDNVALANNWDHDCEVCPYNSVSIDRQTECIMCGVGQIANDAKTFCVPCADEHFNVVLPWSVRGVSVDSLVESHERWPWLTVGDLRSVRSPCTCARGQLAPLAFENDLSQSPVGQGDIALCKPCAVGRVDHPLNLRLLDNENEFRYGIESEVYNTSLHFDRHEVCEECAAGSHYMRLAGADVNHCEECPVGFAQARAGEPECVRCLSGFYANTTGTTVCLPCALCPSGQFRSGCGRHLRNAEGICESCLIECAEGEMATACINRLGVSADPPVCKRKEFLTRTPLCQRNLDGDSVDRGLGLGGFDFETIFGAGELAVPFQCSRVCDAQGGPIDTMTCDGPHACNRMSCTMESSYLDTDLNDFRVPRACPVELTPEERLHPLAHIDVVRRKRLVTCQKCNECGSTPPQGAQGLLDWGRGCVRECSLVQCLTNQIYDWTDHSCKLCSELSNASLCTYAESQSEELATQDVSGNRPKLLLAGCRAKQNREEEALTYGSCQSCRNSAQDCSIEPGTASYHAGCNEGCQPCLHRQNLVLSSAFKYLTEDTRTQPLYCQVSECSVVQPENTPRTGLKDMGSMCGVTCETTPCPAGTFELECSLPHDKRCFTLQPALRAGQTMHGVTPAHANLFEHADSARLHFSNFENILVNVRGVAQNLHQCVWNAVDVRDNDMNPGGISTTFFPPARTYANGLSVYGSKFCHRWTRNRALVYPMLPLQNTVSFVSAFPRRVLINASARVLHYEYSGDGFSELPDVAQLPRPTRFPNVFVGDLYLSMDLTNTPNASLQIFVPDDRRLQEALWIPSLMLSALLADSTAPSTVARPELVVDTRVVSRSPRSMLRVDLELDSSIADVVVNDFEGVHCELSLCRFSVSLSHFASNGSAWVSRNNVSAPTSILAQVFPEMSLASSQASGMHAYDRHFELAPSQELAMQNLVFTRFASVAFAATCPLLIVANDEQLVCVTLSAGAIFTMRVLDMSDVRLERTSTVLSVGTRREESLTLLSLSADFGQQLLLHHHDSGRTLDVQYIHEDVVTLACSQTDDAVWLMRKVASLSAHQFVLVRTVLVIANDAGSTAPRLTQANISQADVLADMFLGHPDIALSPKDTYTMTVSTSQHIFVVFSFVEAQHRFLSLLHDDGEQIVAECSLLSAYPGLNNSFTSSAWTSNKTLVLHMQHNIFTVSCDGARLVLQYEPEALPNHPFVQLGFSYLSVMSQQHLRLSSNLRGANLALQPSESGYCVFVSSPRTTLTIHQLPNAYLRGELVVLDTQFDTELLVDINALGGLQAVHSLRMLGAGIVSVVLQPQGLPVLTSHPLYAHMRQAQTLGAARSVFWDTSRPHLLEVQVFLPCEGRASIGEQTLSARADSDDMCAEACIVLHLTVIESWDANFEIAWRTHGGTAYIQDAGGLREFAVAQNSILKLINGARTVRTAEVTHFSSVQFDCKSAESVGLRQGWQKTRLVVSAHNVRPRDTLMLQVVREQREESLSSARSLAVDAVQLLVVLTSGVASSVAHQGQPVPASRQPSTVSGWIPQVHCCGPSMDIFFGVCPLTDNYVINTQADCAVLTHSDGVVCAARSYVASTESCHCHSACPPEQMRIVVQSGVALMLGVVENFCPPGMHPIDVSSADTSETNCMTGQAPARRLLTAPVVSLPARRLLAESLEHQTYFAAMYVPTASELAQIDLGGVLYGSNDALTSNWQRIFVMVGLQTRTRASEMTGCEFRIRLAALSADNTVMGRAAYSRLFELGCILLFDERGSGECVMEVPTSLALVSAHRLVALLAEVVNAAEQSRCEWPDQDLFTASLVPYLSQNACTHDHFWSQDTAACVSCEMANSEVVDNVCGMGEYIRGCDAISHLDSSIVAECQPCLNANHNAAQSFEWLAGICQWQCAAGFFLADSVRCEACTSNLAPLCGMVAGMRYQECSRTSNEACVKCAPILRGLYSMNEVFVAAELGGQECQSECKPGFYRRDDSCRVCASVQNMQLTLDLVHGASRGVFYRFDACNAINDTSAVLCEWLQNGRYVGDASAVGLSCAYECDAGFHAIHGLCVECSTPRSLDGTLLPPTAYTFTDTNCSFQCRADALYLLRNASDGANSSCVFCNASVCGTGTYLAGGNCSECHPCERRSLVNGIFISNGQVDSPGSCQEECAEGFFADFEQCIEHSVVACMPQEYQMAGTSSVDVMCLPCSDCRGRRLVSACTASRNSECAACQALGAEEEYVDTNCSVACVSGALRNASGICELCVDACLPGSFRDFSGDQTCMQCAPCPPLRANSNFTDECRWTCNRGYTILGNAAQCVPEPITTVMRVAVSDVQAQCNESEFRVGDFECRPCAELDVVVPATEGLGVRWRWSRWTQQGAGLCEFECLTPYLLFVGTDGSKFCYTPVEYSAHLQLLHSELYEADAADGLPRRPTRRASNTSETAKEKVFPGSYVAEISITASVLVAVLVISVLL